MQTLALNNGPRRRASIRQLTEDLVHSRPFRNSTGSLKGQPTTGEFPESAGRLPDEYIESYRAATYVVWSYATPIAWSRISADPSIRVWTVPDVTYSATTTKHQHAVRVALAELDIPYAE